MRPRRRSFVELVVDGALGLHRGARRIVLVVRGRHDQHAEHRAVGLELLVHFDRPQQERPGERRLVFVLVERAFEPERHGRRRLEQHAVLVLVELLEPVEQHAVGELAVELQLLERHELQLHDEVSSAGVSYKAARASPGGLFAFRPR